MVSSRLCFTVVIYGMGLCFAYGEGEEKFVESPSHVVSESLGLLPGSEVLFFPPAFCIKIPAAIFYLHVYYIIVRIPRSIHTSTLPTLRKHALTRVTLPDIATFKHGLNS